MKWYRPVKVVVVNFDMLLWALAETPDKVRSAFANIKTPIYAVSRVRRGIVMESIKLLDLTCFKGVYGWEWTRESALTAIIRQRELIRPEETLYIDDDLVEGTRVSQEIGCRFCGVQIPDRSTGETVVDFLLSLPRNL